MGNKKKKEEEEEEKKEEGERKGGGEVRAGVGEGGEDTNIYKDEDCYKKYIYRTCIKESLLLLIQKATV